MSKRKQSLAPHTSHQTQESQLPWLGWTAISIQQKIIIPLFLLMSLSLLGSTIGFIASTNTTRNRILDEQLKLAAEHVTSAFEQQKRNVFNGTMALSRDSRLQNGLQGDMSEEQAIDLLESRASLIHSRYDLDQVLILDTDYKTLVNLTNYSDLSRMHFYTNEQMQMCFDRAGIQVVATPAGKILAGCAPVWGIVTDTQEPHREVIAAVYTVVEIPRMVRRFRETLAIESEILFVDEETNVGKEPSAPGDERYIAESQAGYRLRSLTLNPEGPEIELLLRQSEDDIRQIVQSGLWVMLFSSGVTLMLVLILGIWLAQGFVRPILKLARVARAVAAGDLNQRARLTHQDEIGQLGRALDQATLTIADLLDQRDRKTGELKAIMQSMADGVLAVDVHERIVMLNRVAARLLNCEREMMLEQPLARLSNNNDPVMETALQHIVNQIRSELGDSEHRSMEECISMGERVVKLQSAVTHGSSEAITGVVVVLQDITRAVESDRSKSAFIATASHELRTPLAGLRGFVDLFRLSGLDNLSDNQRLFLESIQRQTSNLVQLVNDLLEVARFDQGAIRAERRWVSLEETIEEVIENLQPQIDEKQIHLHIKLEPTLPLIWIDSLHLRRILLNLISNAIKYVHRGGEVRVWSYELNNPTQLPGNPVDQVWRMKEKRSVVVEIEDNGVGIPESDQDRVFQRFFRSENVLSVEAGGTGLGLAITRSLVQLHHGQIGFWSVEQEGSCFWVRLPAPTIEPLEEEHTIEQVVIT